MPRTPLVLVALLFLAAPAVAGSGQQVRYVGIHPLPKSEGGGMCYIEGPHVHIFDADKIQYRDHQGANYFVGDPVAYGYDGQRYAYKGHHPIHVNVVVGDDYPDDEYCYISGPHYHYFAPPDGPEFKIVGGAYFYVAEPPRAYVAAPDDADQHGVPAAGLRAAGGHGRGADRLDRRTRGIRRAGRGRGAGRGR